MQLRAAGGVLLRPPGHPSRAEKLLPLSLLTAKPAAAVAEAAQLPLLPPLPGMNKCMNEAMNGDVNR